MKPLLAATCLLLASLPALAEPANTPRHVYLNAGQTYAMRALCAPRGGTYIMVKLPTGGDPVAAADTDCIFGRLGLTFTVPPGAPVQHFVVTVVSEMYLADTKLAIEPDCADGPETACVLERFGTVAGKFTHPGDQDWFRLDPTMVAGIDVTPRPNRAGCFVTAQVIRAGDAKYLAFVGGPAGCGYTATIEDHDWID